MKDFLNWLNKEKLEASFYNLITGQYEPISNTVVSSSVRDLMFTGGRGASNLLDLPEDFNSSFPQINSLDFSQVTTTVNSLDALAGCKSLSTLRFAYMSPVALDDITKIRGLRNLHLIDTLIVTRENLAPLVVNAIRKMENLSEVEIVSWSIESGFKDLKTLNGRHYDLFSLDLVDPENVEQGITELTELDFVTELNLYMLSDYVTDISFITKMKGIKSVKLDRFFIVSEEIRSELDRKKVSIEILNEQQIAD